MCFAILVMPVVLDDSFVNQGRYPHVGGQNPSLKFVSSIFLDTFTVSLFSIENHRA
jgi:hypothetical protein